MPSPNLKTLIVHILTPIIVCAELCFQPMLNAQPGAPTAVEAVALSEKSIRIFWNPASEAVKYLIYRDETLIGSNLPDKLQFEDGTVEAGRAYRYSVSSVDAQGVENTSRPYLERTFDNLPARTICDLIVVGATTAGVAAAVTAARYGMNVVLIEETRRIGGMPVNGLGATDIRSLEHSSGFFEEFRRKVQELYGSGNGLKYEPRVAHQAIKEIVWAEKRLIVHRQVLPVKVKARNGRVEWIEAEDLRTGRRVIFEPKLVVDATECGDVAAWAGAPFRVGRERRSRREPHAGQLYYDRAEDKPLPGSSGRGDKSVQAYAYLMTVKDFGPGADKTIQKPPGYDTAKYEHAPKWETSWAVGAGKLPNRKFEVNQHPHGSDLQAVNYGYPTANYGERRRIETLYKDHALGYLYYIQTVEGNRNIGLSDDDYRDSGDWPPLLYIREARRFESDVVLVESDIKMSRDVARPDAIGLGDYPMDSHAARPKTDWSTPDMGEGEFFLPQHTPWHQVPYGIMIPKRLENVFVPTAVSATHVAYGTLRLEPVRMHFGEAAGIACYLCLRDGLTPRTIPVRQIQIELLKRRSPDSGRFASEGFGGPGPNAYPAYLYSFPDVSPETPKFRSIQWLAARGFFPSLKPAEQTAAAIQRSAPFRPNDPITGQEAIALLAILQSRWEEKAIPAVPRRPDVESAVRHADLELSEPLTRRSAAQIIVEMMQWEAPAGAYHYADLQPNSAISRDGEALYANHIDSMVWDYEKSFAPDGKFYFRPDQPVTRAQFAELLFLVHFDLGPLFEDFAVDKQAILVK